MLVGCDLLGLFYHDGNGVQQSYITAINLFQKACDGGYMGGCHSVGHQFEDGIGVKQNHIKAANILPKSL